MADLAHNRRAFFDFDILDRYEAGVALAGSEVKSIRTGSCQLAGAFVIIRGGEAWLVGLTVPPYQVANAPLGYDPTRARRLLLHRRELKALIGKTAEKGLTLVALRLYTKGPRIKLEFGLARKKKQYDRREQIREREDRRRIERAFREPRG